MLDMQQWTIYAIYKSQAGKGQIPKPKPVRRPKYGRDKKQEIAEKPRSLRELQGFMGEKIVNAGKD
jgi:hypothetical protein